MKNLLTGIDDFKLLRTVDYYYVDKNILLQKFQPGESDLVRV